MDLGRSGRIGRGRSGRAQPPSTRHERTCGWHTADVRGKSYDEMSRLEQKMFWAVREETMLHELPLPEVDDPDSAHEVRWPAELPSDCALVLLAWFDAGLVGVTLTESRRAVPDSEARAILADHDAWSPTHSLVLTDAGEAALA